MNDLLWKKTEDFNFDDPPSEYSFSIRLAHENCWTENFTINAIKEYKKFMFLAAVSEEMVSPSDIIDKVWHQHLIFTKSYQVFCKILGKQIQHIPSTHHRNESESFKEAKKRTEKLYLKNFGHIPEEFWKSASIPSCLYLKQSRFNVTQITNLVIGTIILLLFPLHLIFHETIATVENDQFYISYFFLVTFSLAIVYRFNTLGKKELIETFRNQSLIKNLSRPEIIYLIFSDVSHSIKLSVDGLIGKQIINVNDDKTLSAKKSCENLSAEETQMILQIESFGKIHFAHLKAYLLKKPFYKNVSQSMDEIKKHLLQSKLFVKIFSVNLTVCAVLMITGILRLATGISREKPIACLCVLLLIMITVTFLHLKRLSQNMIVGIFKNKFRSRQKSSESEDTDFEFAYLTPLLMTSSMVYNNSSVFSEGADSGFSNESSCGGSSCGSCGGCGGD